MAKLEAEAGPFALNPDGTAKSVAAFRDALKGDPEKLAALQKEPEVAATVLQGSDQELQSLIQSVYRVSRLMTTRPKS